MILLPDVDGEKSAGEVAQKLRLIWPNPILSKANQLR